MTAISPVFITGGAGFIGSALIHYLLTETAVSVVNIDALTYAAQPASLAAVAQHPRYHFSHTDITDGAALNALFARHRPCGVIHLAAESHVDRSIHSPAAFVRTNITGTYTLLAATCHYWQGLPETGKAHFRFHHVSTDEVFGTLAPAAPPFDEHSPYAPSSPYAASKAAADHLVRAWHRTYGLPVLISHCSNNYGPRQFPEKLIPQVIIRALCGQALPVYGDGSQVRDWLHVDDHARALWAVFTRAAVGSTYTIGGGNEQRNLDVVHAVCACLDTLQPAGRPYRSLITHVADRPGHDARYAVDAGRIHRELGWQPQQNFRRGLEQTVQWYVAHPAWWQPLLHRQAATGADA